MGASLSVSSIPTQGTILTKTQTTVYVMNHILEFILKNADISDIVSLASDEGCKKWLVVAESKLKDVFKKYDILKKSTMDFTTDKDKKQGPIYVQKISELEKSTQSDLKSNYCKVLAFYYIRLFQIVGALALSIQDSTLPMRDYIGTKSEEKQQVIKSTTNPLMPEKKPMFKWFGGAIDGYEFMDSYLEVKDAAKNEYYFLPLKEQIYEPVQKKYVEKTRIK